MNSAIFNSAFRTGIWGSQSFLISLGKIFYWNWNFWLAHFGNLFSCSYKNLNLLQKVLLYTPIYALPLKFHLNFCCSLMTSPAEMVWWISSTRKIFWLQTEIVFWLFYRSVLFHYPFQVIFAQIFTLVCPWTSIFPEPSGYRT